MHYRIYIAETTVAAARGGFVEGVDRGQRHAIPPPLEERIRDSQGHPVHTREERTILHSPRWPFMGGVPLDRTHGVTGSPPFQSRGLERNAITRPSFRKFRALEIFLANAPFLRKGSDCEVNAGPTTDEESTLSHRLRFEGAISPRVFREACNGREYLLDEDEEGKIKRFEVSLPCLDPTWRRAEQRLLKRNLKRRCCRFCENNQALSVLRCPM